MTNINGIDTRALKKLGQNQTEPATRLKNDNQLTVEKTGSSLHTVATAKLHLAKLRRPPKLRRFFELVSRRNLGVAHCQTAPRYQKTRM